MTELKRGNLQAIHLPLVHANWGSVACVCIGGHWKKFLHLKCQWNHSH